MHKHHRRIAVQLVIVVSTCAEVYVAVQQGWIAGDWTETYLTAVGMGKEWLRRRFME